LSETPDQVSKGWDGFCRRVCAWGKFQRKSDKTTFYFLCVHLDHRGKVAQMEGAKQVVNWVKTNCQGENVIVVGDLNVTQSSKYYRVFADSGILKDAHSIAKYHFEPNGTFNAFDPARFTTERIDHIFVSNGITASRWGVLTYHYFRDMKGELKAMDTAAPKEIKGEDRELKCISDHYSIQSFITLNKSAQSKK
jgi:endonuclease/exonuclease/phosphatase family metal-dependent hydrolase